jgi:hypothetical protein
MLIILDWQGGIGFQQLCIFLFLGLAIRFHLKLRQQQSSAERSHGFLLLYTEYVVVGLITVRIIFRLIEYSNGLKSTIPRHEVYQYIFDSTLMLIALVLFNIFHPGRLMAGAESNLPSRKVRKGWKREGLAPRGRVGDDTLLPQYKSESVDLSTTSLAGTFGTTPGGQYARIASPSPSRGNSFDGQGEDLNIPSRPRSFSYQGYLSPREGQA